jgi:hypothetical protein
MRDRCSSAAASGFVVEDEVASAVEPSPNRPSVNPVPPEPTARKKRRRPARAPVLFVWGLFLFSVPFYVAQSGVPQPSSLLIFVVVTMALRRWDGKLEKRTYSAFRVLVWFVLWVCVVDYGWSLATMKWGLEDYVLYPMYYIYNLAIFLVASVLHRDYGDRFLRATISALSASLVLQVAASFVVSGENYRGSVFFNNPNQLGYYALLVACIVALSQPRLKLSVLRVSALLLGCAYLALVSASRAAVGGILILLAVLTITNRKVLAGVLVAAVAALLIGAPVSKVMEGTEKRMEQRKDEDVLETRGYDRLWNYKEYVLVGAGEGDFERFTDNPEKSKEIHSSAATVLFCYGIVGSVLFLLFVAQVMRAVPWRSLLILVPILSYTVTHQGLRFSILWVVLAIALASNVRSSTVAQKKRVGSHYDATLGQGTR